MTTCMLKEMQRNTVELIQNYDISNHTSSRFRDPNMEFAHYGLCPKQLESGDSQTPFLRCNEHTWLTDHNVRKVTMASIWTC